MLFRDEKKELVESLRYTHELEKALHRDGAQGVSLSDKIKWYQKLDESDFDEGYEFRAYKRSLLDGRYNPLRWVAHERNQMMHQKGYLIPMYPKFKLTLREGIKYLNNGHAGGSWESWLLVLVKVLPYLVAFGVAGYILSKLDLFQKFSWSELSPWKVVGMGVGAIVALGLVLRVGEVLGGLGELGADLFDSLQRFVTKNKLFVSVMIAGYLFWHYDFATLQMLKEHLLEILQEMADILSNQEK